MTPEEVKAEAWRAYHHDPEFRARVELAVRLTTTPPEQRARSAASTEAAAYALVLAHLPIGTLT